MVTRPLGSSDLLWAKHREQVAWSTMSTHSALVQDGSDPPVPSRPVCGPSGCLPSACCLAPALRPSPTGLGCFALVMVLHLSVQRGCHGPAAARSVLPTPPHPHPRCRVHSLYPGSGTLWLPVVDSWCTSQPAQRCGMEGWHCCAQGKRWECPTIAWLPGLRIPEEVALPECSSPGPRVDCRRPRKALC